MRQILSRFFSISGLLLVLLLTAAGQNSSSPEITQLFPKSVGEFRTQGAASRASLLKDFPAEDFGVNGAAEATYLSPKGEKLTVTIVKTQAQAGAYALVSEAAAQMRSAPQSRIEKLNDVGSYGVATADRAAFYKGTAFVNVTGKLARGDEKAVSDFARAFAQTLEEAQNEIPVLVKHLPDWQTAQERATYALSLRALQHTVGNQAALDAVSFAGGTEAVTADYDGGRLIIIEYGTPQLAENNDARILERIKQLRESNQQIPTVYRRVGNYSVFVFNAPDETSAAQLIDQVKYEQKIQWLGQNPFAWEYASQQHTQKAVSLILGIARTIGFFVALCLGAGGAVGGLFYLQRRAQQRRATADSYSDAGGMLRLNLDEMTPETDPAKLIGSGDGESVI